MQQLLIGLGLSALLLSGCQTKPIDQMSYSEVRELAADISKRCEDQGFPEGHPEWKACTQQEVARERSVRTSNVANARRFQNALSDGMQNMSDSYNRAAVQTRANRSQTCSTVPAPAGMVKVRCY